MNAVRNVVPSWILAALLLGAAPVTAQTWRPMGPAGGDVRTFAADPADSRRIFLGTSDGHVFGSSDAGVHWQLLGRAGSRRDAVVAAIVVDARSRSRLYAATWSQDSAAGGGVFRSDDGGVTWAAAGLAGHAVRALAQSESEPELVVAGAMDGVFRTSDAGKSWERISPENHEELRNLDSVAIDPQDPRILYAGTFHLPWKTTDGGRRWFPIHEGMIDDSDVMSVLVDRTNPHRIFASACSGIYRSDNAGGVWKKIQGIPYESRRTHVIAQDPLDPALIYAATTEGLWGSSNGGATWSRLTPHDWVINALVLSRESKSHLVIGTERLGVLVSDDGGQHFRASNDGFYHRQIIALALDREHPSRVLAVLANAPEPILATEDEGKTWRPLGPGLKTEGLKRIYASPEGWWASLERGGLMRYDAGKHAWTRFGRAVGEAAQFPEETARGARRPRPAVPPRNDRPLGHAINDMAFSRSLWFAATENGLLASRDRGSTWSILPVGPMTTLPVRSVRVSADGQDIRVVTLRGLVFSHDGGSSWSWHDLPLDAGGAQWLDVALAGTPEETLVANAGNGLYLSRDGGQHWRPAASGLPQVTVQDLAIAGPVLLASMPTGGLYISRDAGQSWMRIEGKLAEGFFPVVTTPESAATIFAASATEGLYAVDIGPGTEEGRRASGSKEPDRKFP